MITTPGSTIITCNTYPEPAYALPGHELTVIQIKATQRGEGLQVF